MSRKIISKYVTPWRFRREEARKRLDALRARDGDSCRRCRRPIRFDMPLGHEKGPKIESTAAAPNGDPDRLEDLFLCHGRCNADGIDHTSEVQERVRRKNEAALFATARASKTGC
jgi:hypothetical protein